jgi:hypothetical protein
MVQYWIDKKGLDEALNDYYPDTLAKDPAIAAARIQMKNGERAIMARIKEMQDESEQD